MGTCPECGGETGEYCHDCLEREADVTATVDRLEVRTLEAKIQELRRGYDRTGVEGYGCPGCVYEDGVFVRPCGLHAKIERLRTALATINASVVTRGGTAFKALWECKRIAAEALGKAGPDSHAEEAAAQAWLEKNTPSNAELLKLADRFPAPQE